VFAVNFIASHIDVDSDLERMETAARDWFARWKLVISEGIGAVWPSTGKIAIARPGYFDAAAEQFEGMREFIDARQLPGQFKVIALNNSPPAAVYLIWPIV
jgi:hypothetical protein